MEGTNGVKDRLERDLGYRSMVAERTGWGGRIEVRDVIEVLDGPQLAWLNVCVGRRWII